MQVQDFTTETLTATELQNAGLNALDLLKKLIATPSISREEHRTATIIEETLKAAGIKSHRHLNNVWAVSAFFSEQKPTLLLNSHHDTVKPNAGYTLDPFNPIEKDEKLYGLGSNDAGASLVCLLETFKVFYNREDLPFNIAFAATAEEEISGLNGITATLDVLPKIDFAIVGEPTHMELAVAENGLLVIDALAKGVSGHAARNTGINAISVAMEDIAWLHGSNFDKISPWLGSVKCAVTQIQAGTHHNVIPDRCSFVIDIRLNELYSHAVVLETLRTKLKSELQPRSCRLRPTGIDVSHPLVKAGVALGKKPFGSPTCSDKALLPCPALKMGPGDSNRSHTSDEFVFTDEVYDGIKTYVALINQLKANYETLG